MQSDRLGRGGFADGAGDGDPVGARMHDGHDFLQPQLALCPVRWSASMRVTFDRTPGLGRHDLFAFGGDERAFSQYASDGDLLGTGLHDRGYLLDFTPWATVRLHRCDGEARIATLAEAELPDPGRATHTTAVTVDGAGLAVAVDGTPVLSLVDGEYRDGYLWVSRRIRGGVPPSSVLARTDPDHPALFPSAFTRVQVARWTPLAPEVGGGGA